MTVPTGLLQLPHYVLTVSTSALLVLVGTATLPPPLAVPTFLALILTPVLLGGAAFEGATVRLLTRSRPATAAEGEILSAVPALAGTRVLVRRRRETTLVQVMGQERRAIVSPRLVEALHQGWVRPDEAAALVVHAHAHQRVAAPRPELVVTLAELPWRVVLGVVGAMVSAFGWLPLATVAWRLRIIVGAVTLYHAATGTTGGPRWAGVLAACVILLTYLVPAGRRAVSRRAELAGDQAVVEQQLGSALLDVLQSRGSPLSLERQHRLQAQPAPRVPADVPERRHLHLVRS